MDPESGASAKAAQLPQMTVGDALEEIYAKGTGAWMTRSIIALAVTASIMAIESNVIAYVAPCAGAEFHRGGSGAAAITAASFGGQVLGTFVFTPIADIVGRRKCLLICNTCITLFIVLSAFSPSLSILVFLRFMAGIFEGVWMVAISFVEELSAAETRGTNTIWLSGILWGVGSMSVNFMAWIIVPKLGWRALLLATAVPFAMAIGLIYRLVESPRWLVAQGRFNEALEALAYMAKVNGTSIPCGSLSPDPNHESDPLCDSGSASSLAMLPKRVMQEYKLLFTGIQPSLLLYLIMQWFFLGFSYTAVVFYDVDVVDVVRSRDRGPLDFEYGYSVFISSAEIVGGLAMMPGIDRPDLFLGGRRGTQLWSYSLTIVGLLLTGTNSWPVVVWAYISRGLINGGTGVMDVQGAEVFNVKVRATGAGFLQVVSLMGSTLCSYWIFAPYSSAVIASGIAFVTFVGLLFTLLIPETALMELDTDLYEERSALMHKA